MTFSTIRGAARALAQHPGHASAFVLTLGLGIGATTAIFSAVEGILIRPLPYPHADRIVYAEQPLSRSGGNNARFSFVEVADYRTQTSTIEEMVEYGDWQFNVVGLGEPRLAYGGLVTSNYFKVLAIRPHIGRTLNADDDGRAAAPVAVLTYEFWQRVAGGDPGVLGRTIELSNVAATIVGVLEPGSHYAGSERAELYANYPTNAHYMSASMQEERSHRMTDVYALVKPGVDLEAARRDVEAVSRRLHAAHPKDYPDGRGFTIALTPWRDVLVQEARPTLLILMGAVALVLVVACANVGNLTLARLIGRERELAVRAALGATPAQLRRELFAEHAVLAVAGAALGVTIAWAARGALSDYAARLTLRADALEINGLVLGFSLAVSLAAAVVFSWAPRLPRAGAAGVSAAGAPAGRATAGRLERRAQRALVAAQIAISFVVLIGAGLLVRTFVNLQRVDPGFVTEDVLSVKAPNFTRFTPEQNRALFDDLAGKLQASPGVRAVATSSRAPFDAVTVFAMFLRTDAGRFSQPEPPTQLLPTVVSPSYFDALEIPIVGGRGFTAADTPSAPRVAVVNETMARLLFADANPIERRVQWSFDGTNWTPWRTIVGVAKDVRELGGGRAVLPTVYDPATQATAGPAVLVRMAAGAPSVARQAADLVHAIDPKRPVTDVTYLGAAAAERIAPSRLNATLFGGFAVLALGIAAIGIGGVLAFSVSERTREFGIRMALGSDPGRILRGVLTEGLVIAGIGLALGGAGALALARLLDGLLYDIGAADPGTFATMAAILGGVALAAAWLPARQATRVDPNVALRAD
jgi:predicted permease